jgi:hypothetical protein
MRTICLLILTFIVANNYAQTRYDQTLFANVDVTAQPFGQNTAYDGSNQILNMDIYTGRGDAEKGRACVVFCFGGAFVQGTRNSPEIVYFASFLAQLGYVCVSIDYRLDNTTTIALGNNEGKAAIRAVQDAKAAVRYIKANAATLGIDSNMIFIGGTSAGGIAAMTLGYSQYSEFTPQFQSLIDSLGGWEGVSNNLTNTSKVRGLFNFSGGVFDTAHISQNDLPIYLNHSIGDLTVPFYSGYPLNGQSATLIHGSGNIHKRMQHLQNDVTIDSFKNANHPSFSSANVFTDMFNTYTSLKTFLYRFTKRSTIPVSIASQTSDNTFDYYPNPSGEKIYFSNNNSEVQILSLDGKMIERIPQNTKELDIKGLSAGIYLIKYNNTSRKLIKE